MSRARTSSRLRTTTPTIKASATRTAAAIGTAVNAVLAWCDLHYGASLCGQNGVHVKPYRRVSTLGVEPRMQALGQVTCVGTCSSHHHG